MGLKRAGPYFQRSMQNKVLNGLAYEICEIYIDDVLIHGKSEAEFLRNVRRAFNCRCQPQEYQAWSPGGGIRRSPHLRDRHLVPATGISFTPEKQLKVLDFPQSTTQKEIECMRKKVFALSICAFKFTVSENENVYAQISCGFIYAVSL